MIPHLLLFAAALLLPLASLMCFAAPAPGSKRPVTLISDFSTGPVTPLPVFPGTTRNPTRPPLPIVVNPPVSVPVPAGTRFFRNRQLR